MNKLKVAISNIEKEEVINQTLYDDEIYDVIQRGKDTPYRQAKIIQAIINTPEIETILSQHYADTFGSKRIPDSVINTILDGIWKNLGKNK